MKKLLISLGLALGLIGSAVHAQTTQTPFVFPTAAYQVTTQSGSFSDISTAEGVIKLGADLPEKTDLKNMMIMKRKKHNKTDNSSPSPAFFVNEIMQRDTLSEVCFPIGFDFKLSGKTMKYFVISALGGIFFSEDSLHYSYQSAATVAGENCFFVHPYVTQKGKTSPTMPGAKSKLITNKAGQPIAYYLTSGEPGQRILTVQHHYLVTGDTASAEADRDEWIFQFKCYEQSNNIDFIVGKLEATHAIKSTHKLLVSFVENNHAGATGFYDPLSTKNMNITTEPSSLLHKIFIAPSTNTSPNWDAITRSGSNSGQFIIDNTYPQAGHTISLIYPEAGPTSIAKYSKDDYVISNENLNGTQYTAKIHLNPELFQNYLETLESGTIVAVLSKNEKPAYTLNRGTYYGQGSKLPDGSQVLLNAFPKFTKVSKPAEGQPNFKPSTPLTISASNLNTSTTYYIHLYRMEYMYSDAPIYSSLCHSLSFTTAMDAPKLFKAGVPTLNSVDLTVTPDGTSEVIIIKSNTLKNLPDLSGSLKKGDKISSGKDGSPINAEVIDIVGQGTITVPLNENESCHFLAYSILRSEAEYTYSQKHLSASVRAAYPSLPGFIDFSNEPYTALDFTQPDFVQLSKTTFRDLPYGWTREIDTLPQTLNGSAFGLGIPLFNNNLSVHMYAQASGKWMDIVSPAFVADKERVLVTYNIITIASSETETILTKPAATDTMYFEYAVEDGEWNRIKLFSGATLPDRNPEGYYPLSFIIDETANVKGKRLRIRYVFKSGSEQSYNAISSVEIKEAKLCETPHTLRPIDTLTSDAAIAFNWVDDNFPTAPSYTVFYKEDGTEGDYSSKTVRNTAETVLDGLKVNTAYTAYVVANCGGNIGDSYESYPATFNTIWSFPYAETMIQAPDYVDDKGIKRKGEGPFNRGVLTATGTFKKAPAPDETESESENEAEQPVEKPAPDLSADLTYVGAYSGDAWTPNASYENVVNNGTPNSVGIRETVKNGWLLMPALFIKKYDQNYPLSLRFKTCAAYEKTDTVGEGDEAKETTSWVKGSIAPQYSTAKLYVLISKDGRFTMEDTVLTIDVAHETFEDRTFDIALPGFEGRAQVAFYFNNPKAPQTEAQLEKATAMLFEIYDVAFDYAGDPCFPLTDLERSNTTTEEATFAWKSQKASAFKISWGLASDENYTDFAETTEPTYTITGLTDNTQYKIQVVGYCDEEKTITTDGTMEIRFMTLQTCHPLTNIDVIDITSTGATFITSTDQPDFTSKRVLYVTPKDGGEMQIFEQQEDTLILTGRFAKTTDYIAKAQAICGTDSTEMIEKAFTTIDAFDIVLKMTPAEAGTISGEGRYEEGTEVTITATPAEKYDFIAWMASETDTLSKDAIYTFKATADVTYTALFAEKTANEDLLRTAFNVSTKDGNLHVRNLNGLTVQEVIVYGLTGKKINHFTPNSREDLILPIDAEHALLLVRVATEQGVTVYKVYLH